MKKYTWYPGSILPYVSLWYIVRRATSLNKLQLEDFPKNSVKKQTRLELLYNSANSSVEIERFLNILGESNNIFKWSCFGNLKESFEFIVFDNIRICTQCLNHGFHSALFSIRLLDTCPIHKTKLVSYCLCGKPFHSNLSKMDLYYPNSCSCGDLLFFSKDVCRHPTLDRKKTEAFDPIAKWLIDITKLILPNLSSKQKYLENLRWLNSMEQLCRIIGIDYPSAFIKTKGNYSSNIVTAHSGVLSTDCIARKIVPKLRDLYTEKYWSRDSPSTWIYRSMSRYLRRHVFKTSQYWFERFTETFDPLVISKLLATYPEAKLAFTEMIWAARVESMVEKRRWPDRKTFYTSAGRYIGILLLNGIYPEHDLSSDTSNDSNLSRNTWLEYQASGMMLLKLWSQSSQQALKSAVSGIADWRTKERVLVDEFSWAAIQRDHHTYDFFTTYTGDVKFSEQHRITKNERQNRHDSIQSERLIAIQKICTGLCLTWTIRDGWHTAESIQPSTEYLKTHRLVGVPGIHPKVWLFRGQGKFVLRLINAKLQVICDTPIEAFRSMRECVKQYLRMGLGDLTNKKEVFSSDKSVITRDLAEEAYQIGVKLHGLDQGFWGCATFNNFMANRCLGIELKISEI